MMNRKTQWMIGIMVSALAGCATAPSGVVPAGQDAYHVSVFGARYETQADDPPYEVLRRIRAAARMIDPEFSGDRFFEVPAEALAVEAQP